MTKKIIMLPMLLALIVGCGDVSSSLDSSATISSTLDEDITSEDFSSFPDSQSDVTSEQLVTSEEPITSQQPLTSDDHISSESSSEVVTSEEEIIYQDLNEIRQIAESFENMTNEANVYASTVKAKFRAQLLAHQDYIAGGSDYTYRNKALVANESGVMLVSMNGNDYSLIKDYASSQQVYDFEGTISYYNGQAEVTLTKRPTYLDGITLDYTLIRTQVSSIKDVFDQLKVTPLNNKAIGYIAEPMNMSLRYLMKLENNLALFSDGINVIQVYGHDKINNSFTIGGVYDLSFMPGLYINKPTFNYLAHQASDDELPTLEVSKAMGATELYSYSYIKEPRFASDFAKNLSYAETLINAYVFEGFVNYYVKDGQANISFDDQAKAPYATYQNAVSAKSLFINNESGLKLYSAQDFLNCDFWPEASNAAAEKNLVEFIFVPYLFNTNGYFQIQVFENTYSTLSEI